MDKFIGTYITCRLYRVNLHLFGLQSLPRAEASQSIIPPHYSSNFCCALYYADQHFPKQQVPSSRQSEEGSNEEESYQVPSFQETFNEAFVTASESVLAAQKGLATTFSILIYILTVYLFSQLQEASRGVRQLKKVARN